jgi:hypothetical protein
MRTLLFGKLFRCAKRSVPKFAKPAKARSPRAAEKFCPKTT